MLSHEVMTVYEISKLLGIKKVDEKFDECDPLDYHYCGVLSTGKFDALHDYDAGVLEIVITKPSNVTECYAVALFTIDDGSWIGYAKDNNFDIDELVSEFTNMFGNKLPTASVLNEFLAKYKIYGMSDG